jgi:PAS domain S-box-containing protein
MRARRCARHDMNRSAGTLRRHDFHLLILLQEATRGAPRDLRSRAFSKHGALAYRSAPNRRDDLSREHPVHIRLHIGMRMKPMPVTSISAALARGALNAAPDPMLIVDRDGIVRFANRKVAELFGNFPEWFVGKSLDQLTPQQLRPQTSQTEETSGKGHRTDLDGSTQSPAPGRTSPRAWCCSSVGDRDEHRMIVIRDGTAQKQAESDLLHARMAGERANAVMGELLASASHDLRQPVQTLALLNGILRRTVTDPQALGALGQQERAIAVMSRLLNSLLDISKLESGGVKPQLSDFAVGALFDGLRRDFAQAAQSKRIVLQIDECDHWVRSDPSLVEQVLGNLLANAIKYTPAGLVRVTCRCERAQVRIEVLDTGIGIPASELQSIYDEFYQVGVETDRPRDGFGLGLSIVRRLVALLDLQLEVCSEVGSGSAFTLVVPCGDSQVGTPRVPAQPRVAPAPPNHAPFVLLVEDDAAVREATGMLLKAEGYRVRAASSIGEALRSAGEIPDLDLLVTDYHLCNGKKGTEVIDVLRGIRGATFRAVIMTGDTSSAIRQLPPDPYLRVTHKPVKADELLRVLSELLSE